MLWKQLLPELYVLLYKHMHCLMRYFYFSSSSYPSLSRDLDLATAALPTTLHFKKVTPELVERFMYLPRVNGTQKWKYLVPQNSLWVREGSIAETEAKLNPKGQLGICWDRKALLERRHYCKCIALIPISRSEMAFPISKCLITIQSPSPENPLPSNLSWLLKTVHHFLICDTVFPCFFSRSQEKWQKQDLNSR